MSPHMLCQVDFSIFNTCNDETLARILNKSKVKTKKENCAELQPSSLKNIFFFTVAQVEKTIKSVISVTQDLLSSIWIGQHKLLLILE